MSHQGAMMFRTAAILLLILFLSACSKFSEKFGRMPEGSTKVTFGPAAHSLAATLNGGVMVYAIRTTDGLRHSIKLDNETHNRPMVLPNGTYRFVAVGWPSANLAGTPRCGKTDLSYQLVGKDLVVPLHLSSADCANDVYGTEPIFRSASTLRPLTLKFCGGSVDVSGFAGSQNCDGMRESYRFFKGDTSLSGVEEILVDPASGRLVFIADYHVLNRNELFSVPVGGVGTVKQNGVSTAGSYSVADFDLHSATGKIVYLANERSSTVKELYVSTIGQPGSTLLVDGITGGGTGVKSFDLAGNQVVFVADLGGGVNAVYAVPLSGGTPVKLSSASPVGTGVQPSGSEWPMEVTPDGASVVFSGRFDSATKTEIYSASVSGAANSAVRLNGAGSVASFNVTEFQLTYDSQYVVWKGNYDAASTYKVFRATIGTGNSSTAIDPGTTMDGAINSRIYLSPDALLVAFASDVTALPSKYNLYTADISGAGPFTPIKVHDIGNTSVEFHNLVFSDDNSKIVYFADPAGDDVFRVFSATVNGATDNKVDRTHAGAVSMPFHTGGGGGDHHPIKVNSSGYAFYRGAVTAGEFGLYQFSLADANPGALVSQAHETGESVPNYSLGDSNAFYPLDDDTDNINQLFRLTPGASPNPAEIPVLSAGQLEHVIDVHLPENDEVISAYPRMLALSGKGVAGTAPKDLFLLTDYLLPSSLRRLTRTYVGSGGVGKVQLKLLEYKTDPAGNIVASGTGIASACLDGPGTDGYGVDLSVPAIAFPAGSGGSDGLFALAVDVYAEAGTCLGTASRVLFPKGLANASASPQAAKLRAADTGSGPVLFIKD